LPGLEKGGDNLRIELVAALALDLGHGLIRGPGALVGTLGRQGVEHIRDGYDPAGQWDIGSAEPERIATPIPALMMRERDLGGAL
jgi:hypothetical protein